MSSNIRLIPSGFEFIDDKWGGIYKGGSYVLVGPRKSGRTLLGLQFALEAAKSAETCLYFTNMRPKDLMIQAASINFDIQSYMNQDLIIVVRVAPPNDIYDLPNPDEALIEYLNDIITVVNQYNPSRIIFDELTPYIGFKSISLLRNVFLHTLETVEDRNITSMFVVSEPATQRTQEIVETLAEAVTGIIYLKKQAGRSLDQYHGGKVIIRPNVGHTQGQFSADYRIEPYKGVIVSDFEDDYPENKPVIEKPRVEAAEPTGAPPPPKQMSSQDAQQLSFSNLYDPDDFKLVLNNQIAFYKSTGQTFNLVSIKLDPAASVKGLLSVNQLQNALRMATSKKDKICVIDNKVMVLIVRSSSSSVSNLISDLQQFLPSDDANYLATVGDYISVYNLESGSQIDNAEDMMESVTSAEANGAESYIPLSRYI